MALPSSFIPEAPASFIPEETKKEPELEVPDSFAPEVSAGMPGPDGLVMPQLDDSLLPTAIEPPVPEPTWGTGFRAELKETTGDVLRGALGFIPSTLRTFGAAASDPAGALSAIGRNVLGFVAPGEINVPPTPSLSVPEQHPAYQAGEKAESMIGELFPRRDVDSELWTGVREGLGQMGSMLATGGAARAMGAGVPGATVAATTLGGLMEFDDAFKRARERKDDPDTAFAKALGYATVASLLENRLGAGRTLRQLFPSAAEAAKKITALGVSKKIAGNFVSGGVEEGAQRAAQNWIVDEKPSLEGVMGEALPGAIVQGITGLPSAGVGTRQTATPLETPTATIDEAAINRGLEERTTPYAVQQETTSAVRDVQQPEVTTESAEQVPATESGTQATEARVIDIVNNFGSMPIDQFVAETTGAGLSVTKAGYDLALRMNDSDKARMQELESEARKRTADFLAAKDPVSAMKENNRVQFFNEAVRMYDGLQDIKSGKSMEEIASQRGLLLQEFRPFYEQATKGQPSEKAKEAEVLTETPTAPVAEPVPMGAATASEFTPPVPFVTSNKNAIVDQERAQRGLPPMMSQMRQSNQDAWDAAMREIDQNPQRQDELIAELTNNPRALTTIENALLLHRRVDLRNEYEKALKRWKQAFDDNDLLLASEESQRVKEWNAALADLEDVTKRTGRASGQSLQARKMMANEDFSLVAMELRAMEAKGRELTNEEHIELIKAQQKITELQNRLFELEGAKEAKDVEASTTETLKEVSSEAPKEAKSKDFDLDREDNLLSGIKAKVDKGQTNDITSLVQQLARVFWRRGVRGREPMIDELHGALKTIIPEFTRDDTKRAFSGYGNFKPLSKEEIDVGLRDLRGQTQQVLKMEAIEARKPLEKTGQERRVPSDEERRLIKQVNELKRKYGVVVTDPATQLKSALAARKTYYEHRIADLRHEIETRQRIVKSKSASPSDPELQALIAEHERLKEEHAQIFTKPEMTDEQRLKMAIAAAQRNQAHWEVRLENAEKGVFDKRTPGRKVTSAELELIQAETAAVREHVKELHDLDAAVVEAKRTESLARQKATLEKNIAELERKVIEKDLTTPGTRMSRPAADPDLEALLQQRDELNKQLAEARKEARKKPDDQKRAEAHERELKRLNKAIDERLAKVAAGDVSTTGKKANRPMSPELEQARQQLEMVNKQLAALRKASKPVKSKEEIALQSIKTRMKTRIAEFKRRVKDKDFAKKVKEPTKLDAEATKIKAELDLAKEEFETKREQDRWARMSVFQKTKRTAANVYDAARALMTTGEFSFILRQGKIFVLSHPIKAAKALPNTFKALLASEQRAREIDEQTLSDPAIDAARAAKVYFAEEGASLPRSEEILMGRLVGKIPVVRNFNNAARVFLNRIRLDLWKAMSKSMTKSGTPTPEESRQIAMFVNESTGRGGLGPAEQAAIPLARAMFSPRYYASRWQLALGHSMWGGTMRSRRIIATEYARALVGLGLYYTALAMFFSSDDDEEKGKIEGDPRSGKFGKVQIGNTVLDPLAGLSQAIVLGSRTGLAALNAVAGTEIPEKKTLAGEPARISGKDVPYGGDKWTDIVADHFRGKLHPVPASIANLFDGTDLGGDEATLVNQAGNLGAPITWVDIWAALKEQGLDDGAAISLLGLLGEGIQTYKEKED